MTDQKVVDTFEATAALLATINKTLDLQDAQLRTLHAMTRAHADEITALSNRIESLTAYTRELHNYKPKL